jgi:hypothetical protein
MRVDLAKQEAHCFQESIETKLSEYTNLFNRFKGGEELTDEERTKMVDLSDELEKLSKRLVKE